MIYALHNTKTKCQKGAFQLLGQQGIFTFESINIFVGEMCKIASPY